MKKIFESEKMVVNDEELTTTNQVLVFAYEDEDEADEFPMLAHKEQLAELGLKEESTPSTNHATFNRYFIEPSDSFVVVNATNYKY